MADLTSRRGDNPTTDDALAWWRTVIEGEAEHAHPTYGASLQTRLDGDTLVVSGTLPNRDCLRDVRAQLEKLGELGITINQDALGVGAAPEEASGVLAQTLIATYDDLMVARLAEERLAENPLLRDARIALLSAETGAEEDARRLVPEGHWDTVEKALAAGQAVLIVTVDETEAFKARKFLDEDTRSVQTMVLPPQPAVRPGAPPRQAARARPRKRAR